MFEGQWEESAAIVWPEYRTSFYFGRDVAPGMKRTQFQIDSSAQLKSYRFGSVIDWLVTPSNLQWVEIKASDPDLMKQRRVKTWFEQVTQIHHDAVYAAEANFVSQNQANMQGIGVFGNAGMMIDELFDPVSPKDRGLRFLSMPVGEIYILTNHQRKVVGYIRAFRLTAQQAKRRWPIPVIPVVEAALSIGSQQLFDFLQFVLPRDDYHPGMTLSDRGMRYASVYVSWQGHCVVERGGYRTLPLAYARWMCAPDEDYGRGPTQMILPSLKTKNAVKAMFLKQGHRAGDPVYLVHDQSLIDMKLHNGAINAGGMTQDGKMLVGMLPTGQIQITKEMMEEETAIQDAAYLQDLFRLIFEDPKGLADPRAIMEYINERGIYLFPTVGGLTTGYVGPMVDRNLDILSFQKRLPPMPPELREARGQYKLKYCSPIARAMQAQEGAGYLRTVAFGQQVAEATGDPGVMDIFDFDVSLPEIGEQNNAPGRWFTDPKKLAQRKKARQDAQQREDQIKALPGQAAMAKAQAITAKAQSPNPGQGGIGGALTGTPQGGMPQMPGQAGPGGRNFGGNMPQGPQQPQMP